MKQAILNRCLSKELKDKDGAKFLQLHPKSFSRLKHRYLKHGIEAITPHKPGPKAGNPPPNRTSEEVEQLVEKLAKERPFDGPLPLSDRVFDEYKIKLNSTTVWRILQRRKVRYTVEYKRWKPDPKLYCLDSPGLELQMDACYPYGRARRICLFDAIDDCSRYVVGKMYYRETALNAIDFVKYLLNRCPFHIQRIRVDNRYGHQFKVFCKSKGIEVIENEPYSPEQNGKIERFHKTVKREFFWRYCSYTDAKDYLQYKLVQWLNHYNTKRRHGGYGMNRMTPQQKIATTLLDSLYFTYPQKVTLTMQQYNYSPARQKEN